MRRGKDIQDSWIYGFHFDAEGSSFKFDVFFPCLAINANLNSPGEESRGRAETSSWLGTSTVAGAIVIHSGACLPGLLGKEFLMDR